MTNLVYRHFAFCKSGYSQLTKTTLSLLKSRYNCLELDIQDRASYKEYNDKNIIELFVTPVPESDYMTLINSQNVSNNRYILTMWESTNLLQNHINELRNFKKIFVPSVWNKEAFNKSGFENVEVLNLFVDDNFFYKRDKKDLSKFIFGTGACDLTATGNESRKNIKQIIKVFNRTFGGREDIELHIKLSQNDYFQYKKILGPQLKFFSYFEDQNDYAGFLSNLDVFISPAKAEGWGFMQMESLAVGRPLICPAYSALTEYLTNENHYSVQFEEKVASASWGLSGGKWAYINEESLSEQMLKAYNEKDKIRNNWQLYSDSVLPKFNLKNYRDNLFNVLKKENPVEKSIEIESEKSVLICSFFSSGYSKIFYESVFKMNNSFKNCSFYVASCVSENNPFDFSVSKLKNECLQAAKVEKPDWMVLMPGVDSSLLSLPDLTLLDENTIYFGRKMDTFDNRSYFCSLHLYSKKVYENYTYDENFKFFWDDFDFFHNVTKDFKKEYLSDFYCSHKSHASLCENIYIKNKFDEEKSLFLDRYRNIHGVDFVV